MSKKLLIFVIVLVSFALTGIIYVQLYYIKNAYAQNELRFDQKVNMALSDLVDKLEQNETFEIIHKELKGNFIPSQSQKQHINYSVSTPKLDSVIFIELSDSLVEDLIFIESSVVKNKTWNTSNNSVVVIGDKKPEEVNVKVKSKSKSKWKRKGKNSNYEVESETWVINADTSLIDRTASSNYYFQPNEKQTVSVERHVIDEKALQIKRVIRKMVTESDANFNDYRKKLKYELVDSLLRSSLKQNDLDLVYNYSVFSENNIQNKLPHSNEFDAASENKKYEADLFPNDIIPKHDKLVIYFPGRQGHLLKSLSFLLPSSLVFSLIIIIAFAISIMMVVRQKKISDIKSDFINNMTHEFKTPIATISLAADTVINPKVINDQGKIGHFISIIKEENTRMNLQVERILQMSLLDKRELDLNLSQIDLHQLLQKSVQNINMQLLNKEAKIKANFNATQSIFDVDEIHFTNVVNNLLDNALKYSKEALQIIISTEQTDQGIILSVEDNGIGMTKEAQTKIFDKFYRVTKGNIHNVKGFGLGLSYVKAIVEAHGGKIHVKSELNVGSRFDIFIPQKRNGNGKTR